MSHGADFYASLTYTEHGLCECGAPRQHLTVRYLWNHPEASRKQVAQALGLSAGNVREAIWRLKRRGGFSKVCPQCNHPSLQDLPSQDGITRVCTFCGAEPLEPNLLATDAMSVYHFPPNSLLVGGGLGTQVDSPLGYGRGVDAEGKPARIRFRNWPEIVRRKVERGIEMSLVDRVRSDIMNALDGAERPEVTETAGRLILKEFGELQAGYPDFARSKLCRKQIAKRVLARLRLMYPWLNVLVCEPPEAY